MSYTIDINCDLGESYGQFIIGSDTEIFPLITSCNIACGFHGGDPLHLEKTVRLALEHSVQIGAHPSYPDLWGFGRRPMKLRPDDLKAFIRFQVAALSGVTRALGGRVAYVKPHGALYHAMARDADESRAVIEAIISLKEPLAIMGLAGSATEAVAKEFEIVFVAEGFADRRYEADGFLMSRDDRDAVIHDPQEAAEQVISLVTRQQVSARGQTLAIEPRSICVHGDHPNALSILRAIDDAFGVHGIRKNAFVA